MEPTGRRFSSALRSSVRKSQVASTIDDFTLEACTARSKKWEGLGTKQLGKLCKLASSAHTRASKRSSAKR